MKNIVVVGSINYDMTIGVDYFVKKGETILGNGISYSYGGKGANQACAIAKLGGSVKLLGAVGSDSYGVEMLEYLSKNKVDVSSVKKIENINTGLAVINVNKQGENNIVVIPGANLLVDKEYIDNNMEAIINCDAVVLQLEIPIDTVNYVIDIAKKYNKDVVLNPAPVPKDYANIHMDGVTYLSPNEIELEQILKSVSEEELLKKIKYLILTKGAEGSVAYSYNKEPIEVKAFKVTAVDTVAAGDCYNGALIVGISEGMELQQAMKFASMASSIAVGRKGAQTSIPTRAEVDASIDINKKGEKK